MRSEIKYVELKGGAHTDLDEAWIARVWLSKSGKTVYFNGKALIRGNAPDANHVDLETGDLYWISGVKKRGTNRHWGGQVFIEKSLVDWYDKHTDGKRPADIVPKEDLPIPDFESFHQLNNQLDNENCPTSQSRRTPSAPLIFDVMSRKKER